METPQAAPTEPANGMAELRAELTRLHRSYDLPTERADGSSSEGRGLRALVERAARPFLRAQVRFNATLMQVLELILSRVQTGQESSDRAHRELLERLSTLESGTARLSAAEEHLRSLDHRTAAQESILEHAEGARIQSARELEQRVSALERELSGGRARGEALLARLQEILTSQGQQGDQDQQGATDSAAADAVGQLRAGTRGVAGLAFEDLHRGERAEIKERLRVYLPYLSGADAPVLDLGCGRGEFLELAHESGLTAEGLDLDPEMVAACRARGLVVHEGDALEHLRALPDASLGGILMTQVIEHLTLDQMTELVALGTSKLRPGAAFIAETVNPECLSTFAGAFYLDLTHIRPIHPEAARFLWRWAGLGDVEVLRLSPHDERDRLELSGAGETELGRVHDRNAAKLNGLIYGYRDYAVVGYR